MEQALVRIVALCALSAVVDLMLTGGKLQSGVRLLSGALVIQAVVELLRSLFGGLM